MTPTNLRVIKELFVSRFDRSQIVPVAKGRFTKNKPLTDEKVSSLKTFAEYIDGILNGIYSDLGLNPSGEDRRLILETLVEEEILDAYRLAKKGDVKSPV